MLQSELLLVKGDSNKILFIPGHYVLLFILTFDATD